MNKVIRARLFLNRKIDEKTGCWLWKKGTQNGYGCINIKNKSHYVHRISYEEFVGPLKNLCLHKPICPNKRCFNPDHLYDGDYFDNMQDMITVGNHSKASQTHCKNGHKFDRKYGWSRHCSICSKARNIISNKKKKFKYVEPTELKVVND